MERRIVQNAWQHFRSQRLLEAEQACVEALQKEQNDWSLLHLLAVLRQRQGHYSEAAQLLRKAISASPRSAELHNNLGMVLGELGQLEESVTVLAQAIRLRPGYARAYRNLGLSLTWLGRMDEALWAFREAVVACPKDAGAHANLGRALLLAGELREGFTEYEWRLRNNERRYPVSRLPLWDGSALAGRSILVRTEQGLGDTVQFARYIPLLARKAARVVFQCQPRLVKLLSCMNGPSVVVTCEPDLRGLDLEVWLLSLPHQFGTTLDGIPSEVPYLFSDPTEVERWKKELPPQGGVLRVGIAWQGSPGYYADRQRSIPLSSFEPLTHVPEVELVCLQKGYGREQLSTCSFKNQFLDLAPRLDEGAGRAFCDTAAVLANLDLLITSDTAIAHLAGALGVSVWVALPFAPDWRWLMTLPDSPWYPTMRLFRQKHAGDWGPVFDHMAEELRTLAASRTTAPACYRIEIGAGELVDRLTILRLKCSRSGRQVSPNMLEELSQLEAAWEQRITCLETLASALASVNRRLWEAEDDLRLLESKQMFGQRFVELARSVYRLNDHRSRLKRTIDQLVGFKVFETKVYAGEPSRSSSLAEGL